MGILYDNRSVEYLEDEFEEQSNANGERPCTQG
jgi:hypothetical protein